MEELRTSVQYSRKTATRQASVNLPGLRAHSTIYAGKLWLISALTMLSVSLTSSGAAIWIFAAITGVFALMQAAKERADIETGLQVRAPPIQDLPVLSTIVF